MSIFNESLFQIILNMSITSSVVIFTVLIVRIFFKKLPKAFSYALWFLVLFRLLCPVTLESSVSIFNLLTKENNKASVMEPVPYNIGYQETPEVNLYIPPITDSVNQSLPAATPYASINPMQFLMFLTELLWCIGMVLMLLIGIYSALRLKLTLRTACRIKDNIYYTEALTSPFVYGIISPRIYLPANLSETEKEYIILHEQTHIKRFDHFIKLLWHISLCIHWFNPLVWISFRLMERDMEMSCDEAVIKVMGEEIKVAYSSSLLQMSSRKKSFKTYLINPLAFGETSLKTRVKNILSYKRPVFWITSVSVTILLLITVTLLTNPRNDNKVILKEMQIQPENKITSVTTAENASNNNRTTDKDTMQNLLPNDLNQNSQSNYQNTQSIVTMGSEYKVTFVSRTNNILTANNSFEVTSDVTKYCIDILILQQGLTSSYSPGNDLELLDNYIRIEVTAKDYSYVSDYYLIVKNNHPYMQNGTTGNVVPVALKEYMILSYLLQPDLDVAKVVEDNLQKMLAFPLPYSNLSLYAQKVIEQNTLAYENILKYGDRALSYMLTCFQKGEGDTLKGQLMMLLCKEILGVRLTPDTDNISPTEWFLTFGIVSSTIMLDYTYEGEDPSLKLVYETETQMRRNENYSFLIPAVYIWKQYEEDNLLKVIATVSYSYYTLYGLTLTDNGGGVIPVAITYKKDSAGNYVLKFYEEAEDGSYFIPSIQNFCITPSTKKIIPGLADKIISNYSNSEELLKIKESNLEEYLIKKGLNNVIIDADLIK